MAHMASSDPEVKTCSKTCLKNYEALKKPYADLLVKLNDTDFKAATYKRGLATLEGQIVKYREHEVLFSEEIALLKRSVGSKEYQLGLLRTELEKVKQEKDAIDLKIEKFDKASKDLDQLLGSQITDKSKKGFGYSAVPPPHPLIYNRPNKLDLSYSGLEEFQQPEFEVYGLRANKNCTCKHKRHVNGQREEKPLWKNTRRVNDHYSIRMTHSNPRRNMIPQAVLMRSGIKAVNTAKPKDAHNAVKRNRFNAVKASACKESIKDWDQQNEIRDVENESRIRTLETNRANEVKSGDGQSKAITEASLRRHLKLDDHDEYHVPTPNESPLHAVHSHGSDEGSLKLIELTNLVTKLSERIEVLEDDLMKTKQTYSSAFTKLILRIKKLETTVKTGKARKRARVVLSEDEEDDSSKQGRIDEDPNTYFAQDDEVVHDQEYCLTEKTTRR
ncbi:hypothetical protein Tco_0645663 [Tanacetum coccineum]